MSAAVTLRKIHKAGNVWCSDFTIAFTGTYASGGDTLSLAAAYPPGGDGRPPFYVSIDGSLSASTGGVKYDFQKGTTGANGKVHAWMNDTGGTNSPLVEHSNAAVVAAVSDDTVRGVAFWSNRG